uniref:AT4G39970 protein n=1 Tax=Arabidopsis thaliana TaxID=3702 RepID=C0Z2Q0_ARATH|nr:AT4G39970 [Arabidopsis thaliana]
MSCVITYTSSTSDQVWSTTTTSSSLLYSFALWFKNRRKLCFFLSRISMMRLPYTLISAM